MPFPTDSIRAELINLILSQEEFQYFIQEAYKKIKKTYGLVVGSVFLEILKKQTNYENDNIYELSYDEYVERIDNMILALEEIKITTIPKESPDYELVLELSKK